MKMQDGNSVAALEDVVVFEGVDGELGSSRKADDRCDGLRSGRGRSLSVV